MFFRFKRVRRDPYTTRLFEAERPIRLDEARLDAWALALGQRREADRPTFRPHRGQLPDVDFSQLVRVDRPGLVAWLLRKLGRRGHPEPEESGASGRVDPVLGETVRRPYVWLVEAESGLSEAEKPKLSGYKLNGSRAA